MLMLPALFTGVAASAAAATAYFAPHALRWPEQTRLRARCAETRTLVLSYDDGPGATLTPTILDALHEYDAKATFFLLGHNATDHPHVVDRIVEEGHEVGSHGDSHVNAWRRPPLRVAADIAAGYRAVRRWAPPDALFRPPYGKTSLVTRAMLLGRRSAIGWWTVDSGDTADALPDPDEVVAQVRSAGGGVVLLHDFDRRSNDRHDYVLSVTRKLLACAKADGLQLRRLGDLLREEGKK